MFRTPLRPARSLACIILIAGLMTPAVAQVPPRPIYLIDGTDGPPTDEETMHLELINRARANPPAEGQRLATTTDPDVVAAVTQFRTDLNLLVQEFNAIAPAPPLAFNAQLLNAARLHSRDQFTNRFQGHNGSNGSTLTQRLAAARYSFTTAAENVYASARTVFHGHAGFEIDWGNDAGGMQAGRGHRVAIHSPAMREIGVGVVLGTNGPSTGPQVVTQNFGAQATMPPLLTGVAYYDLTGDDFYSLGEGLGGILVQAVGSNTDAITAPSGAFTLPLPGNGTFTVRFTRLGFDESATVTVSGGQNVKLDLKRTFTAPALNGPAVPPAGQPSNYTVAAVRGASRYQLESYRRETATPTETADDLSRVTLDVTAGYDVVQTGVRAQGAAAFNLRAVGGRTQTITLGRTFLARPGAAISFASRLTAATPNETARVQVSTDGGLSWSDVFAQAGTGAPGEASFTTQTRSLASLEGRIFQVRLVHAFTSGSFFATGSFVGWYVDDIRLPNCDELLPGTPRDMGESTSVAFTPELARTNYVLRVAAYNGQHRLGASELFLLTSGDVGAPTAGEGGYLANLSVRTRAGTGAETLIVGFAVSGGTKPLLVRGIGPALSAFGLAGALTDPRLELYSGSTQLQTNDNWNASAAATFTSVGAFPLANNSLDAAIVTSLPAGSYTAQVAGAGNSTGIALVELYDTAGGTQARLSNVSARSQVGTGADILVAGFNIAGTSARTLLIRAVGPTLSIFGVGGVLANPQLDLFRSGVATAIASNDNWDATHASRFSQVGAFNLNANSNDAVLVVTLEPGSYTAQVTGVGNTTGVALVEVYELP